MADADWLAAVAGAPDDPLVRLAYADWLDDHDDPRGEQLRLDLVLAGLADDDQTAGLMRRRLAELVPGTDACWRAAVCRVPVEVGEPFVHPRRHPLNVNGPWYTCGDCMSCGAPEALASDLLAPLQEGNTTTHFVRQPHTAAEVERACAAAKACCMDDLRYGGTDPVVIRMLDNNPAFCDHLIQDVATDIQPAPPPPPPGNSPWIPAAAVSDPSPEGRGVPWGCIAWLLVFFVRILYQAVKQ